MPLITTTKTCTVCFGTGLNALGKKCLQCKGRKSCVDCKGMGFVPGDSSSTRYDHGQPVNTCGTCEGTGAAKKKCKQCAGTGTDPATGAQCSKCAGKGAATRKTKTNKIITAGENYEDLSASIEVGEFASELVAAVCYRERTGLVEGDWLDDPTRAMTDGACFAEEIRRPTQNTFQVTVSLDISRSMYGEMNTYARVANPLFYAMHRAMQQSLRELPPGMLVYAPFTFGSESFRTPEAYMPYYKKVICKNTWRGSRIVWPPSYADEKATIEACPEYGINPADYYQMPRAIQGGGTCISSLFGAIRQWENEQQVTSPQLTKLDIVITDGALGADTMEANRIQAERSAGCKIRTVLLNVTGQPEGSKYHGCVLPDHTQEFGVQIETLQAQVRNTLMDTISELLA